MNDRWLIRSVAQDGAARYGFLAVVAAGLVAAGLILVLRSGGDGNLAIQSATYDGAGQEVRTDATESSAPSSATAVLDEPASPQPATATPGQSLGTPGESQRPTGPSARVGASPDVGAKSSGPQPDTSSAAEVGDSTSVSPGVTSAPSTAAPQATAALPPSSATAATGAGYPSDRIDMASWKITLPISRDDFFGSGGSKAAELKPGGNEGVSVPGVWEIVDHPIDGPMARFRVTTGGARTSSGTKYARTELRQLVNGGDDYWSFSDRHTLTVRGRVMETPPNRPEVVVAQIKAGSDEVARVEWDGDEGWNLVWDEDNTEQLGRLGYDVGAAFLVELVVDDFQVSANVTNLESGQSAGKQWRTGLSKAASTGGYFKAGAYVQSQAGVDDAPDAVADVWFSQISL